VSSLLAGVRSGFYAQKQIASRSRLIAWSHQGRFRTALRLARDLGGERLLDYGCGDGTFLGMLAARPDSPLLAMGAELHQSIVEDCRARFRACERLRFELCTDLESADSGSFDVIFCMEVLEHIPEPGPLLDVFDRLLAPSGVVVISVPIEIGLPVVVKQMVRTVAGWRGIGHYPGTTPCTGRELVRSVFAGEQTHLERPLHRHGNGQPFHDHKGFNWRRLRRLVRERFDLIREDTSPVGWLGPQLGTQRWFVAKGRRR
jgi:SAM-dependent methyltransferase